MSAEPQDAELDKTTLAYAEEIAHFVFGRLAISGLLTEQQLNGELRVYLIEDLIDGINLAASMVDRAGYRCIGQMIEDAQWGRLHRRK